ncbi:BTAD domain-containing putative transcriptional regulator [Streptomyces sp. ME02-8801-2C]|uniref:BTAD domain-containing putative transcriptional regulator n=1 Tax=Streptomyces sp. ME02-8801-2C TaxID=3028680 RepID=UPI0029A0F83C|nr:BTAD domain-containing putative transcriptional regulator [Streptomyces sp. ME02-8801-2C]MDX3455842.1 BTAD domain-containing putative transcriptional regulator [Streptomyces sp. ME02-8801-2C]
MWFKMLGPLEVVADGQQLALGGSRQRATLGYLLLHPNQTVPISRLLTALWSVQEAPTTARKILQNAVWGLRRTLATGETAQAPVTLRTQAPGYSLDVTPDRIDLHLFHRWTKEGRSRLAAGEPDRAARLLSDALELWRGPALADLTEVGLLWPELTALENARLDALEDLFEAQLACGRHYAVLGELESTVESEPLRERACGQLMRALYRCGRQADALGVFNRLRAVLVEDLGLEPSRELQQLQQAILTHDPDLQLTLTPADPTARRVAVAPAVASPVVATPPSPYARRPAPGGLLPPVAQLPTRASDRVRGSAPAPTRVAQTAPATARFALAPLPAPISLFPATQRVPGLGGSAGETSSAEREKVSLLLVRTELDPAQGDYDALDVTMGRLGSVVQQEIERFGGAVVSSMGDITLGLFPTAPNGEEHALHAARAADALRRAVPGATACTSVGAVPRAVVMTGEALVSRRPGGTPPRVNGALVQDCGPLLALAAPGDVLVCERTRNKTEEYFSYEEIAGLPARWRLLEELESRSAADDHPARTSEDDSSHRRELELLQSVMTHSSRWSQPHLITVLGDLDAPRRQVLHELTRIADEELAGAQVLTWNGEDAVESGPYGLHRMVLSTFAGVTASDPLWTVRSRIRAVIERLTTDRSRANRLSARCASLFDAVIRPRSWSGGDEWTDVWQLFLEAAAQDGPIVLIVDDLHLADTAAVELVGLLAQLPGRIPLTVIVGATPELLCNLDWSPGKRFATVVMLDEPTDSAAGTTRPESLTLVRDSA